MLTDEKARAAFDAVIAVRQEREKRTAAMDATRRRFRDELAGREADVKRRRMDAHEAAARLQAELTRLREEGARRQQEQERELAEARERARVHHHHTQPAASSSSAAIATELDRTLKLKWKKKEQEETMDESQLTAILSPFGPIEHLAVSKKGGSALCVFQSLVSAVRSLCAC